MKIRNYTQEELDYIRDNFCRMTVKEIAEKLNKTPASIGNATRKMGLIKQPHKKWTDYEVEFLKKHYVDMSSEEIGKILHRSIISINGERDRLGLVRDRAWTEEEIKYLYDNFRTMTYKEIGKVINRTDSAIRVKCFEMDFYKAEPPWTDEEINFLKENYREMVTADIAKYLNRSIPSVQITASKLGIKKYPYTCDYGYFDNIDTEEKAYWLGFLTADGWINKNEETGSGVVGIELQYGDFTHLRKFNKSIEGNYKITDRWRPCNLSKNKDKKIHTCVIRIFSSKMYNSLVKQGFTNTKSFDCHIPNIKDDLLRHYIRGYFDGDGCFTLTNKSFHVNFVTASKFLNEDIKKILDSIEVHHNESSYVSDFNTTMYRIDVCRKHDKIKFLDWIYGDCNIYLNRKYKKYIKAKNKFESYNAQSLAC